MVEIVIFKKNVIYRAFDVRCLCGMLRVCYVVCLWGLRCWAYTSVLNILGAFQLVASPCSAAVPELSWGEAHLTVWHTEWFNTPIVLQRLVFPCPFVAWFY